MSEYWKSTPKYWCKHCKTFVKDTKFEKTNHEATPKHQGNLKRFLRELHKGHEREERDKQRAKNEVDRLNGVLSGSGSNALGNPSERKSAIPTQNSLRQATPADRKKQLAQLAELGVAVPEDFRKEMAMVGDWQTTSQRPIYDTMKKEEEHGDVKPEGLSVGVRKRKFGGQDEEEEAAETVVRKGWGSTIRTYPGTADAGEDDLDALLSVTKKPSTSNIDTEPATSETQNRQTDKQDIDKGSDPFTPALKREEFSNHGIPETVPEQGNITGYGIGTSIKQEDDGTVPGNLFKKRKSKPIRQK